MFTANLAHEVKPNEVLAVVVHPGFVQTEMGISAAQEGAREGEICK